jgi:alpha-2-macroglobulin
MRDRSSHRVLALLTALLGSLVLAGPAPAAKVTHFSPQGTVKQVRQTSAAFSEPMVAFGDPAAADPFDVTCPVPGQGRWVDTGQWVYDFERDLPAGIRCAFRLRAGLVTLGGQALTGSRDFAFATGGPAIRSAIPHEGSEWIDEEQAFVLALDAEPTSELLRGHVGFAVEGIPQRVEFRIVTGDEREVILKARLAEPPRGPVLVIQAVQRFPDRARVILVWGKGVAAESGVATDTDQSLHFKCAIPSPCASTASARTRMPAASPSRRSDLKEEPVHEPQALRLPHAGDHAARRRPGRRAECPAHRAQR